MSRQLYLLVPRTVVKTTVHARATSTRDRTGTGDGTRDRSRGTSRTGRTGDRTWAGAHHLSSHMGWDV